jgi:hypothetical protein
MGTTARPVAVSINVTYFFNANAELPDLAKLIGRVLGCSFQPYEGDASDLFCRFLSLETSLRKHSLEDDMDLPFSRFRYQLDTRTPVPDAELREIQLGFMALIPSLLQARAGITSGMLVYDVQRLLASYEMRGNEFFDVVSGKAVSFPCHFQHVCERSR